MNKKAKELKKSLGSYKSAAIMNIVLAVIIWINRALMLGAKGISQVSIFDTVLFVMMGFILLINGIKLLQFVSETREVLQDIVPDDD